MLALMLTSHIAVAMEEIETNVSESQQTQQANSIFSEDSAPITFTLDQLHTELLQNNQRAHNFAEYIFEMPQLLGNFARHFYWYTSEDFKENFLSKKEENPLLQQVSAMSFTFPETLTNAILETSPWEEAIGLSKVIESHNLEEALYSVFSNLQPYEGLAKSFEQENAVAQLTKDNSQLTETIKTLVLDASERSALLENNATTISELELKIQDLQNSKDTLSKAFEQFQHDTNQHNQEFGELLNALVAKHKESNVVDRTVD